VNVLRDIWQIHEGLISVAFIFACLAAIGWASDEWGKRKEEKKDKKKNHHE